MSIVTPRATAAVSTRVLTQLRRDHRTLVMLLVLLARPYGLFGTRAIERV